MKRKVCEKCGAVLDQDTVYCQKCGHKVKNENVLKQEEVKKNIFGLLSMYTFLLSITLFTFIPVVLSKLNIKISLFTSLAYVGYGLSILFEVIAIIICQRNKSIDKSASGVNFGSASMMFSLLMIIAKIAHVY